MIFIGVAFISVLLLIVIASARVDGTKLSPMDKFFVILLVLSFLISMICLIVTFVINGLFMIVG